MIGSTEAEAQRLARELNDLSDPEVGRKRLSGRFGGHDFSHLRLDATLTPEDFPDPGTVEAARSRTEVIIGLVRREKPTLRQLLGYLAGARGHFVTAGTPEQIADLIEDWFHDRRRGRLQSDAADIAGDAGGVHRRSGAVAAAARTVSHGLRRPDPEGALRAATTGRALP